jgi:type II secretory pathway pseudopilin PulG
MISECCKSECLSFRYQFFLKIALVSAVLLTLLVSYQKSSNAQTSNSAFNLIIRAYEDAHARQRSGDLSALNTAALTSNLSQIHRYLQSASQAVLQDPSFCPRAAEYFYAAYNAREYDLYGNPRPSQIGATSGVVSESVCRQYGYNLRFR